ncbi:MAG: efflux RND transporter periplasmic adaptor subunit [Thermacetogeniaceae bacterium]
MMSVWRKRFLAFLLIGVLTTGLFGCGKKTEEKISVEAERTAVASVDFAQEITGTLVPARTVNIFTKLTGQVKSVSADVGDNVRAGQLLIQLDTPELEAQLRQAEAAVNVAKDQAEQARIAVESAKINLDLAQKTYDRMKALADAGAVSQSQLDEVQTKLDLAKQQYASAQKQYAIATGSALRQAEAAVETLRTQLANREIVSPISGTVTNRNINPGELAAPGVALLTIADTSALKLGATVPQAVVSYLRLGQAVKVTVDALPGRMFEGKIVRLGPVSATTGEYFPIEIEVKNTGDLKAGMTGRARLQLSGLRGIVVPLSAVKTSNGKQYVFVVKPDGTVRKRAVTLGPRNDSRVVVVSGLKEGEMIAVSNVRMLRDGLKVNVVKKKERQRESK